MSICSLKSDNRNTAVRRPPCVKGAVTAGDWGIVSDGELDNLRILQQARVLLCFFLRGQTMALVGPLGAFWKGEMTEPMGLGPTDAHLTADSICQLLNRTKIVYIMVS